MHERDDLILSTAAQANIAAGALPKDGPAFLLCTETHAPTLAKRRNELHGALCRDCQRCIS
jgi:hypothetical protein